MHEMALCEGIVDIVEQEARKGAFSRVKTVWLEIGTLSHVAPDALRFCFEAVTANTIARGAALEIIEPEGAEQPVSVFPIGEEALDAQYKGLTASGALAKLASMDSEALARSCPRAVELLSTMAAAIAAQTADAQTQLFRLDGLNDLERRLTHVMSPDGQEMATVKVR